MHRSRWIIGLLLLAMSGGIAMADGVDPKMGLIGGGGSTGLFSPNDPNFSFTVLGSDFTTVGQSREFDFINAINQTAVGVDLVATLLAGTPTLTFACVASSEYFNQCSVTPLGGGQTLIRFFDPNNGEGGFGGIPSATDLPNSEGCDGIQNCSTDTPGADFGVVVTDVDGDLVHLGQGQGFSVRGSLATPEPSTILLALAGGVLLLLLKRS